MAGALAAGVLVAGVVTLGPPAVYFLTGYGCGDAEDRLAGVLAGEGVLEAEPEWAEREESYRSCDDDDLFVVAGARYELAGSAADSSRSVLGHYRQAALADGWQAHSTAGCFTKAVGGTTAYLQVENPADGGFHVEIVAQRDGSQWC
ncbi:hypothetical protein [Streptomyces aurantiogriseus]|uniref:Uncharacterized protein n=1 Tax=Streptomyces aurantiogriseus TaxID=66870 RepID=A0A918BTI7_9ACTN|nr:hypothetical protein [Streptomyces aurantiogriseus]GGQ91646.1 hypothetical protein GCM10010251_02680 [Streptomyces aurantiogriseus]